MYLNHAFCVVFNIEFKVNYNVINELIKKDNIIPENKKEETKFNVKKAFEDSLKDVCMGLLPLGGGVNRGNGCFSGILTKNGEVIYEPNKD